jgi:hypothetical protein
MTDQPVSSSPEPITPASKSIFKQWSQVVATVSSLTVLLAVVYNWAYFKVAAPHQMELLTLSDHIAGALEWLPVIILSMGGGWSYGVLIGISRNVEAKPKLGLFNFERNTWLVFACTSVVWILVLYLIDETSSWFGTFMPGMFLWMLCIFRILDRVPHIHYQLYIVILLVPLLVAFAAVRGNIEGLSDFTSREGTTTLVIQDGDRIEHAVLLRELEKGALLRRVDTDEIAFVPWQRVSRLITAGVLVDRRRRICVYLHLFCSWRPMN